MFVPEETYRAGGFPVSRGYLSREERETELPFTPFKDFTL